MEYAPLSDVTELEAALETAIADQKAAADHYAELLATSNAGATVEPGLLAECDARAQHGELKVEYARRRVARARAAARDAQPTPVGT